MGEYSGMRRPRPRSRVLSAAVAATVVLTAGAGAARAGNTYSDQDYARHDIDNVGRSSVEGRQHAYVTDPAYNQAFTPAAADSFLKNLGRQVADADESRVYGGLGQLLPGGAVGDPTHYYDADVKVIPVDFVARTGAKLSGRIFFDGKPGAHRGVVITPGSIQGTQHFYWWAARTLARNGFMVMTWDAQGQGESEVFGHDATTGQTNTAGFPFQQEPNFVNGTVDALDWFLSDAAHPYKANSFNFLSGLLDHQNIGLAGHSLGARAISVVQQCSDQGTAWTTVAACGHKSYPIRTAVAWDALSGAADVTPVVPAMDQEADGYFLNPTPSSTAPAPGGHLGAFNKWVAAGVDSATLTVRGGTHIEWVDVPYILPSTTYGIHLVDYYTAAWFDRYLGATPAQRQAGEDALLNGPTSHGTATERPWAADFLSARTLSAYGFHRLNGTPVNVSDLRAAYGVSAVGDWAGANADKPAWSVN